MLFHLLDQVQEQIDAIDLHRELPGFIRQLKNANPGFLSEPGIKMHADEKPETVYRSFSLVHLALIKSMKKVMIRPMIEGLVSFRTPLHVRYALASSLAYFVQPHDLIPDDAPGGYGFIDDYIILRAAYIEYLALLDTDPVKIADANKLLNFAILAVSKDLQPVMKQVARGLSTAMQLASLLPADMLETLAELFINDPITATLQQPATPARFTPTPAHRIERTGSGSWQVDGGNIYGPNVSLYNGQVYMT
jgi:uncharacterized membrane protein YkvA (DUF1232 family)